LAAYTPPATRDDLENWFEGSMLRPNPVIPAATMGLTPIFPLIDVVPVVEIPVLVRIA
jgi:hypothetical protein